MPSVNARGSTTVAWPSEKSCDNIPMLSRVFPEAARLESCPTGPGGSGRAEGDASDAQHQHPVVSLRSTTATRPRSRFGLV